MKSTKDSGNCKEKGKTMTNDKSYSPDENKMALIAKKFTKFFQTKKNYFCGTKRDTLSRRYSRLREKSNNSDGEVAKHQS